LVCCLFFVVAQLTPAEIEARRKSGFKLVEWRDDNGVVQLISADSAAVLQAKRDNAANNNMGGNGTNIAATAKTDDLSEKISYKYYLKSELEPIVIEEKEITTTTMVERNGQMMKKNSSRKEISETSYRCLPLEPSDWQQFATGLEALAATNTELALMQANWRAYLQKNACLPPFVLTRFLTVLPSYEHKKAFVADIYATCADPKQAELQPFVPQPVVVAENKVTEPTKDGKTASTEVKEIEPELTAKELKARQKAELKALKAAEKAAAKAKKAAEKAAKAAEKEAAKANKSSK
jgi:hypothetical protein